MSDPVSNRSQAGTRADEESDALRRRVEDLESRVAEFGTILEGFSQLSEQISSCFWVYEIDRERFGYISASYETIWKRSRRGLYEDAASWMEPVHPEDRERVLAAFAENQQGRTASVEFRIYLPDGEWRWLRGHGVAIESPVGVVRRVVGHAQDITERKQAEEGLAQSQAQFQRLLDSNIIGISVADVQGAVVEANDAFLHMLGYTREDLPLRWDHMTPPEWRAADERGVAELRDKGFVGPLEKELFHKDGHRVPLITGAALVDESGDECIGIAVDITDRKRAEEAVQRAHDDLEIKVVERTAELTAARERLQTIADSLPALIGYVDTNERYVFNNAAYEQWFGIPRGEVKGRLEREVIGEKAYAVVRGHIQRALAGERVTYDGELTLEETHHFHVDLVPHFDSDGSVLGYHVLAQDLTAQKRAEQKLRRAERLASLGTMAAGIAHEINNPVGVILLAAEAGRTAEDDAAMVAKAFRDIIRNAKRCTTIVDNVMKFSRERTYAKQIRDLNRVIRAGWNMVREYAGNHGVKVDFVLSEEPARMLMNATEIEQIVVNLIQNSVQARASRIEIRTEVNERIHLTVRDDGEGIAPENRTRIFEPFYTGRVREGGTGLGLSILHGIVREHGGEVEAGGEVGRGAVIRISFQRPTDGDRSSDSP
jgi:PAS domain S-box-containing protein